MPRKYGDTNSKYDLFLPKWKKIDDICDSANLQKYLVKLNPTDISAANVARNQLYYERAVFYALAGFTARGLSGLPFRKWPKLEVPAALEYMAHNADGAGVSLYQQAQGTMKELVRKGRAGLLVEYPETEPGRVSQRDVQDMKYFATIYAVKAEQIIDWEYMRVGAHMKLCMLEITDIVIEDGEEIPIIRRLTLEDIGSGLVYVSRQLRKIEGAGWEIVSESIPLDASQKPWQEIPFQFCGSETNTAQIDQPPMYDNVQINVGHWNNSATYEQMVHYTGQVQPWMSGLDQNHIDLLKANNMYYGCSQLLSVPEGGAFGIAQGQPNTISYEAMKQKVEISVGLGAMFISPGSAVKTATQSAGEQQVQHSVLSLIASNLSEAYTQCLIWACRYMGAPEDSVEFTVQQDFLPKNADSQMLQQMVAGWMQSAIPFSDLVTWMQKQEIIDPEKTLEDVQAEIGTMPQAVNLDTTDEDIEDE